MRTFFGALFGAERRLPTSDENAKAGRRVERQRERVELPKKGDVIGGIYEVRGTLGKGGFGVVYLAHHRRTKELYALKTFRDELLADAAAREAFKKEALLWVGLEQHPFIVAARWVENVSGRLFVMMDYVVPDAQGRVNLADHLVCAGGPLDAGQTLKWGVQFCMGMEHAQARGLRCHRDIKPANILITQDGTLKISDFGLATAAETAWRAPGSRAASLITGGAEGGFGLSLMQTAGKARCGTPGYMAPEVYRGEGADIRSDLYSFGLVLWQMATGSRVPPFVARYRGDLEGYLRETYEQQMAACVPITGGSLGQVIERCLRPKPAERYGSFAELRGALEPILERKTGMRIDTPQGGEKTVDFWILKGGSLETLGRHEEALKCYDQALASNPRSAWAWNSKGDVLAALGQGEEALRCYGQALAVDPRGSMAWINTGVSLAALGRGDEALKCYDQALAIDPREAMTWMIKGGSLHTLGRGEEALKCYDQALTIDPRHAMAWCGKGVVLAALGQGEEALRCYDQALAVDPRDAAIWINKGRLLAVLGRGEEALRCYDQALAIDPRDAAIWTSKGVSLEALGRREEALKCYDQALAIDPRYADTWFNKGASLADLGRCEEALKCYDQALAIDPRCLAAWVDKAGSLYNLGRYDEAIACSDKALAIDPQYSLAWHTRAGAEYALAHWREALSSYRQFVQTAPAQKSEQMAAARKRIDELEAKGI